MRIGEIKLIGGKLIKCVKSYNLASCEGCCFDKDTDYNCLRYIDELGDCSGMGSEEKHIMIYIELRE